MHLLPLLTSATHMKEKQESNRSWKNLTVNHLSSVLQNWYRMLLNCLINARQYIKSKTRQREKATAKCLLCIGAPSYKKYHLVALLFFRRQGSVQPGGISYLLFFHYSDRVLSAATGKPSVFWMVVIWIINWWQNAGWRFLWPLPRRNLTPCTAQLEHVMRYRCHR